MWIEPGDDASVRINFQVGDDPVIPDVGTVKITVRDNAGTPLAGFSKTPVDVDSTSVLFTIPGANNMIAAGKLYENRFVIAYFNYNGMPFQVSNQYGIYPFIPVTATPADARRHTGFSYEELPDDAVDITAAYINLAIKLGSDFTNALTSGTEKQLAANNLVALRAALDMAHSFQMRMALTEQSQNNTFTRHDHTDVQKLIDDLAAKLDEQIFVFSSSSATTQVFFMTVQPTDVITG